MREERQNRLIKKRNIVLIGSMGTGKSHVGRMLARELGWQFIDTDRFLERERGMSLAELGATLGADALRQAEAEVIERVRRYHHAIIAVGGNFVLEEGMFERLCEYGVVVLLYAKTFRIIERVARKQGKRPTIDYDNLAGCVADLNRAWYGWHERADCSVNTTYRTPTRLAYAIRRYLHRAPFRFLTRRGKERHKTRRKGYSYGKKSSRSDQWRRRARHERRASSGRAGGDL